MSIESTILIIIFALNFIIDYLQGHVRDSVICSVINFKSRPISNLKQLSETTNLKQLLFRKWCFLLLHGINFILDLKWGAI